MQSGRDPRTNEPVYVAYDAQFGKDAAAAAGSARGRGSKGARKASTERAAAGAARGDLAKGFARAAGAGGAGGSSVLGRRAREDSEDVVEIDTDEAGGGRGGCGAHGDRRLEWDQVGQKALPAGGSTFSRGRPASVHALGGDDGEGARNPRICAACVLEALHTTPERLFHRRPG